MAYHITELRKRLNSKVDIGKATWLQIKQAQLDCKSGTCITILELQRLEAVKLKHNLAYKILTEARRMNLSMHSEEIEKSLQLAEKSMEIAGLLNQKDLNSFCQEKKLGLFFLEQLIDQTGSMLSTWKQIRKSKKQNAAGRKPTWFTKIEELVLVDADSRRVKSPFRTIEPNTLSPIIIPSEISDDRRVKDWVLVNTAKGQEMGRVVQKGYKKHVLIEYWQAVEREYDSSLTMNKCKGCDLN